jgi:hypothetical protein
MYILTKNKRNAKAIRTILAQWLLPVKQFGLPNYLLMYYYSDVLRAGRLSKLGSIPGRGKKFFSPPQYPDWLCGPSNPLYNVYNGMILLE